jgi:4-amino-4-deoxy-L-arabinose transferase-like glycosyltransferase
VLERLRRLPDPHALLASFLAASVVAIGVIWNTRTAAGSDAYGYVSQADLWRRGNLFIDQPFARDVPWPDPLWTFTPLGYRPAPDGDRIVPTYSPGFPMLMAIARTIAGTCAMFWIVPLAGGVLVFSTYAIGRRIGRPLSGLAAAWLVATSPAMLFMLMAPMSDVPAAAAWAVAAACMLGVTTRSALTAGVAAAIAILIRPNLAPVAAAIALWALFDDARRAEFRLRHLRPVRSSLFAIVASAGAIGIAIFNARLYGSPLASGYGDLSTAYSLSFILPNVQRYGDWIVSAETPLALAGLAALFVPARWAWPEAHARRARPLLTATAAVVWISYLVYVPWDAWWYLRFLLPAWPMMAIGTASLLAAAIARVPSVVLQLAIGVGAIAFGVLGVQRAERLGTFAEAAGEAKYVEVGQAVQTVTSPDDVIVSGQFSGTLRYYAGRLTLRWDFLDPTWLDRAVEWLGAHGHHVYILLEAPEAEAFRLRFEATNTTGRLNWVPTMTFRRRAINLYDATRRDRMDAPIAPPALSAVRECPAPEPLSFPDHFR